MCPPMLRKPITLLCLTAFALVRMNQAGLCDTIPPSVTPPPVTPPPSSVPTSSTGSSSDGFVDGFIIDLGYNGDLSSGHKNATFYQVSYKGKMLSQHGTAPNPTDITNAFQTPNAQQAASGDTNAYSVVLKQGVAKLSGGYFDALGNQASTIPLGFLRNFRGDARLSGTTDGKTVNTAVGLESLPLHPLQWIGANRNRTATDWLLVGIDGERQSGSPDASNATPLTQNAALATYRTFIGKAFGWHAARTNTITQADVLKEAKTLAAARKLPYVQNASPQGAVQREVVELLAPFNPVTSPIKDTDPQATDEVWWKTAVVEDVSAYNRANGDTPTNAVYFESSGWYTLSGNPQGSKAKAMFGLSFQHWISDTPNQQSTLEVRYEDGYDRAAPTLRIDRFLVTINFAL